MVRLGGNVYRAPDGSVRGILQLYHPASGLWGRTCGRYDPSINLLADTACRQMGYVAGRESHLAAKVFWPKGYGGKLEDVMPVVAGRASCVGKERSVQACDVLWGSMNDECDYRWDTTIMCTRGGTPSSCASIYIYTRGGLGAQMLTISGLLVCVWCICGLPHSMPCHEGLVSHVVSGRRSSP